MVTSKLHGDSDCSRSAFDLSLRSHGSWKRECAHGFYYRQSPSDHHQGSGITREARRSRTAKNSPGRGFDSHLLYRLAEPIWTTAPPCENQSDSRGAANQGGRVNGGRRLELELIQKRGG